MSTINCKGKLIDLSSPIVMGILNVTPDSFFDGGLHNSNKDALEKVEKMLNEEVKIIDIGGMSSRPNADFILEHEELQRVIPTIEAIMKRFPEAILSVDTVRSSVAKQSVEAGASIINDISAGNFDDELFQTVADLNVPYVLMHMKGNAQTMHLNPTYENVTLEVMDFFIEKIGQLRALNVKDIILDVGFGFGKTVEHNYQLLKQMHTFSALDLPILAGISRKSMIYKVLQTNARKALNGTTALHMVALQQGAKILRAHDVKEAKEVIELWTMLENS